MKKLLQNRIVTGLVCIVTALIICFGLTPMFNDALKSKVKIVRVSTEIKKGDKIMPRMLATVEAGGYNLPGNVIYKAEDVIGKYANTDLYKGDYVLKSKLSDTPRLKNEYLNGLDGTNRAISVTIKSFAEGLSGKLERGDIVSLIASDVGEARKTLIPAELQYIEIIATTTSSGMDNDIQEDRSDGGDAELASAITVLATPEQARLLAELEQTGKLHAALVYRGDSGNAQRFLDEQSKVLKELYPANPTEADPAETEEAAAQGQNADSTQSPGPGGAADVKINEK